VDNFPDTEGIEFLASEPVRPDDSSPCLQARQGFRGQTFDGLAVSYRHENVGGKPQLANDPVTVH
jgi:hypothetical protein